MKFIGGVLDGMEFDVNEPVLRVPVKDGEWYDPPDMVVTEYQLYVRNGDVYELK